MTDLEATAPGVTARGTTRDDRTDFGDRSRGLGPGPRLLPEDARGRYRLEGLLGEGGMESARALAEDLARFLDDEPILARPASWAYRLAKRVRKHRGAAAIAAAGLLLVAGFGRLALHTRWQSGRQAALAQRFGEEEHAIAPIRASLAELAARVRNRSR